MSRRRNRRRVAVWLLAGLGVFVLVAAFVLRPAPVLGLNGDALQGSVGGDFLGPPSGCRHLADGDWMCSHNDRGMSGTVSYRVEVDSIGCWEANRVGYAGEGGSAKRMSGCVTLFSYVF